MRGSLILIGTLAAVAVVSAGAGAGLGQIIGDGALAGAILLPFGVFAGALTRLGG